MSESDPTSALDTRRPRSMTNPGWWRQFWLAMAGRAFEPATACDSGYRMVPCPVRPFRDEADRAAALGAALVFVTREITGEWPRADAVKAAIDALLAEEETES